MTTNTNNTGIMHAVIKFGGRPLCGRRNAIMATEIEKFRTLGGGQCKRCAAKLAEMDAAKARKPAGTIDLTPTWAGVLPLYLAALCDGTPTARSAAESELRRMAALADTAKTAAA